MTFDQLKLLDLSILKFKTPLGDENLGLWYVQTFFSYLKFKTPLGDENISSVVG